MVSTKTLFKSKDILEEVKRLYLHKIIEKNYMPSRAAKIHVKRRVSVGPVGRIINSLGTHKKTEQSIFREGKSLGLETLWRKIE